MTATDEIGAAFNAALAQDAGRTVDGGEVLDFEAPPPKETKAADRKPRTARTPRKTAAAKTDEKPRTAASAPAPGKDYTDTLTGFGMQVWAAGSMIRGFELGKRTSANGATVPLVKVPDLRPYAAVFNQSLPGMVSAWNTAAQQDARVRGWVEKLTGDGSPLWLLGVVAATGQFAAGCAAMAKAPAEVRAEAAAANDAALQAVVEAQIRAMGLAA